MKLNIWRVAAFFLLIALSIGFGFAFDAAATALERQRYPRAEEYTELVSHYAEKYAIPEAVVWATIKTGSNFASNAVSQNGAVGLMQLTPARFDFIFRELLGRESPESGLLYDPETNLEAGCAWLSYLYDRYLVWDLVFAAYHTDTDTVDGWLTDPDCIDESGILVRIPDPEAKSYMNTMEKTVTLYRELYYEP